MSDNHKKNEIQFDRRTFIKGIAATGAITTIAASHPATASQPAAENTSVTKSWRDKPDPIDEGLISDGGTYDVVVVGGGHAGVLCARAAGMKGASVAVVESQAEKNYVRGSGGDVGTVNSQYMLSQGAPRIDESDFLREWARRSVIRHNPRRISYFVKNSGKVLDFMIKDMTKEWLAQNVHAMSCPPTETVLLEVSGWKFYFGTAMFGNKDMFANNSSGIQGWTGLMKYHQYKAMADGARWFYEHHAEICDLDGSGAVTGVVAKKADGKYVRFKARKGIALCAGDFSGNREMVIDLMDELRNMAVAQGGANLIKATGNTRPIARDGSGIKLGVWAGGHVEIGPRASMPSGSGAGDPGTGSWFLQLDHKGERFCDETIGTTLAHPIGSAIVTFCDSNYIEVIGMMPPRHMAPDTSASMNWRSRYSSLSNIQPGPISSGASQGAGQGMPQQGGIPDGTRGAGGGMPGSAAGGSAGAAAGAPGGAPGGVGGGMPGGATGGMRMGGGMGGLPGVSGATCSANTIEELIDYTGCYSGDTRKKALAEINRYNQMCEKGVDEDFGKDPRIMKVTGLKIPPFYATVGTYNGGRMFGAIDAGMCVVAGLDTDADGRVLNSEFKPIQGLYAAGNNAGGRFIVVYQSPMAGISIGMAITEGYMLGERLADL